MDPYLPTIVGQFQQNGDYVAIFSEDIRKMTDPKKKFIGVKELRTKEHQK